MTSADEYRTKAAMLRAHARYQSRPSIRAEIESLARAFVRLAEQAERNNSLEISYETPPPSKDGAPQETGNRQATRCREMAEKATDERTRNHWMSMAQFWIERAKEKETKVAKVKV